MVPSSSSILATVVSTSSRGETSDVLISSETWAMESLVKS